MNRRQLITIIIALALTITAQGQTETIDSTQFVAVYDYECRTQNDEGQASAIQLPERTS